jgi:hypothetical protein
LKDELKTELGMKIKKEEREDEVNFFSLNVPIDAANKDSKTYNFKTRKYDMGLPEDFLKWRTPLNEQIKKYGFARNYEMAIHLARAILTDFSLDAFVKERRAQEVKNKTRLAKKTTELTVQQFSRSGILILSQWEKIQEKKNTQL